MGGRLITDEAGSVTQYRYHVIWGMDKSPADPCKISLLGALPRFSTNICSASNRGECASFTRRIKVSSTLTLSTKYGWDWCPDLWIQGFLCSIQKEGNAGSTPVAIGLRVCS